MALLSEGCTYLDCAEWTSYERDSPVISVRMPYISSVYDNITDINKVGIYVAVLSYAPCLGPVNGGWTQVYTKSGEFTGGLETLYFTLYEKDAFQNFGYNEYNDFEVDGTPSVDRETWAYSFVLEAVGKKPYIRHVEELVLENASVGAYEYFNGYDFMPQERGVFIHFSCTALQRSNYYSWNVPFNYQETNEPAFAAGDSTSTYYNKLYMAYGSALAGQPGPDRFEATEIDFANNCVMGLCFTFTDEVFGGDVTEDIGMQLTADTSRSSYSTTATDTAILSPYTILGGVFRYEDVSDLINVELVVRDIKPVLPVLVDALQIIDENTDADIAVYPSVSDSFQLSADQFKFDYGAAPIENIGIAPTAQPNFNLRATIAQALRVAETVIANRGLTVTETLQLAEGVISARAVLALDELGILGAVAPRLSYNVSHAEEIALYSSLLRFFGADVLESVGITSTPLPTFYAGATASDQINAGDTLERQLVLRLTASDEIELTPTAVLNLVYELEVTEEFEIGAAYIAPGDNFTTWAVNPKIGAVTEYTNWQFNSFTEMGSKYLGASADGLYELNGDSDNGQDIIAQLKSGWLQIGGSRFTSFKAAYLGVHGGGDFYLKLESGDGKTHTYQVTARDKETTKVQMGKGLRARYFSYELTSVGQDFDLDSVEFVPIVARRRV